MASSKTIAARILDRARIDYDIRHYTIGDADFSAEAAADLLELPTDRVFKTLVAVGDRTGPLFAVIPGGTQLELKLLAAATGDRRVELAARTTVQDLTGYARGAVTVLGARRPLPTVIDETAELHETIGISGGAKGVELLVAPADYIAFVGATIADIAR